MDRLHHLRETLPKNLRDHRDCPGVQFVLLDYSSRDGVAEWVRTELGDEMAKGRLLFFQLFGAGRFFMAHAKNVSHRLAGGEILCNVDADAFTGPGFAQHLIERFQGEPKIFLRSAGERGTRGRIALRREHFHALAGYDERMKFGWGMEDGDLCDRARAIGLTEAFITADSQYLEAVKHARAESTRNYTEQDRRKSQNLHRALSRASLREGRFVANQGNRWGAARVLKNFSEWTEIP